VAICREKRGKPVEASEDQKVGGSYAWAFRVFDRIFIYTIGGSRGFPKGQIATLL